MDEHQNIFQKSELSKFKHQLEKDDIANLLELYGGISEQEVIDKCLISKQIFQQAEFEQDFLMMKSKQGKLFNEKKELFWTLKQYGEVFKYLYDVHNNLIGAKIQVEHTVVDF